MSKEKVLRIVKITCSKCGHLNLVPVIGTSWPYETVKCGKCGKVIATCE